MQFKCLIALLLVDVCLAQVSLVQSNTDIQQKTVLINQAKTSIETFTNVTTEKIHDALNVFNQQKDQVKMKAQEAIVLTKEHLNNVTSDTREQILEIAEEISACIAVGEDQFKQLLTDSVDGVVQCVQKEIDSAFEIINESIAIVTEVLGAVQALPRKLKDCGIGLFSIQCVNRVVLETEKLEAQLPLKIAKQVAETTKYVAGLKIRLEVCTTTQVAEAGIKAAEIVAKVGTCAAEAIGGKLN